MNRNTLELHFIVKLRASRPSEFYVIYTSSDIVFRNDNKKTLAMF